MQLQCELVAERNLVNPNEITWTQYDILITLTQGAKLPSELSRVLGLTRSKLSKNLVNLRNLNYIEQVPSKNDHREMITSLTITGKELLSKIDVGHQHLAKVAAEVFSTDEQAEFARLANKMNTSLQEERIKND
nr:MarR family winged helix-turn-helix transcriptional regulator [Bombilactobacillus apium]